MNTLIRLIGGSLFFFLLQSPISIQAQSRTKFSNNGGWFMHTPRAKNNARGDDNCYRGKYRNIDGTCNNTEHPEWGATEIDLLRELPAVYGYADKNNALGGQNRSNPRTISNIVANQTRANPSKQNLSSFVFTWGQFLDHDITLTPDTDKDPAPIPLPKEETKFRTPIKFNRSAIASGTGRSKPREQFNLITAWIDGSNIYGSDPERANWLRTFKDGKLKTSKGNLLPYNTTNGEFASSLDKKAPDMAKIGPDRKLFVAGDVRANEQPGLTALHTLFVREHNRICEGLVRQGWTNDEEIYQTARKEVGAQIQHITYNEFLPALGIRLPGYRGYRSSVRPDIINSFSTAAFRFGHTLVTKDLPVLKNDCSPIHDNLSLIDGFFDDSQTASYGIDPFLKGLASQTEEELDVQTIDELRNFLFAIPGAPFPFGLDLVALNIQRGRDHGLPDYNKLRTHFTRKSVYDFHDITSDHITKHALSSVYKDVNDIDAWVGMLAEDHIPGTSVGPTLNAMIVTQFQRLRDGDYFYFENDPNVNQQSIKSSNLANIIKRNTNITNLQSNVFIASNCGDAPYGRGDEEPDDPILPSNQYCQPSITFVNTGCKPLWVYLSINGKLEHRQSIDSKKQWTTSSEKGAVWYFYVDSKAHSQWTVPDCDNKTFSVDSGGCGYAPPPTTNNCYDYSRDCNYLSLQYSSTGNYKYDINATYNGGYELKYWTVNGNRVDNTATYYSFKNYSSGTYVVCAYYWCNGRAYKCCKDISISGY